MRRAYPHYRDSEVGWLGDIPAHWRVSRLERVASYSTSNVDKKTEDDELPVRLCNYTDVYYQDRIRASSGEYMQATASLHEIARFQLCVGDTLITKDSEDWKDIGVPALVEEAASDFLCGYHLGIIHPSPELHADFLFRAMQTTSVNRQLQVSASGVTRFGLPNAAVGEALLPLPPLAEQHAIAAFLDRETVRIDKLVEKNRLLIERLAEYRTAMIARAVTRGLDPSAPLKRSGVEWLGDIPEHWEVRRLKHIAGLCAGTSIVSEDIQEFGEYPVFGGNGIRGYTSSFTHYGEHPLIGRQGALCGVVNYASGRFWASEHAIVVDCVNGVMPNWLTYTLDFLALNRLSQSAAQPGLAVDKVGAVPSPLPPLDEQRAIADHIDREAEHIDALTSRAEAAIERLQEYRAALITSAVTGKIDVREPEQTP